MTKIFVIGIGGFVGALCRYGLSGFVQRRVDGSFPAGTLVVNLLGCLVIGALMCLVQQRQFFTAHTRLLILTGFLGSLTTFSTFGYETFALIQDRQIALAVWNAATNVVFGFGAVAAGWTLVKALGV